MAPLPAFLCKVLELCTKMPDPEQLPFVVFANLNGLWMVYLAKPAQEPPADVLCETDSGS